MYKIYFRQAIQMLMQNKFMSIIAILGTALAIMMIMAIIVSEEMKNVSVSPEVNRYRTYYMDREVRKDTVIGSQQSGSIIYETVNDYLYNMEKPELVSAIVPYFEGNTSIINMTGSKTTYDSFVRLVDAAYWKIISFNILKGRTFSQEEFDSGIRYAVISESMAKKIFHDQDPLGKSIDISFKPYHIIGVVEDISPLFHHAYGEVWVPYTSTNDYKDTGYLVMFLAKTPDDYPAIYAEVRDMEKKYGIDKTPSMLFLQGPFNHRISFSDIWGNSEQEVNDKVKILNRKMIFILVILLLVPALNLSGLSLSRIKKRTSEIGVRKAFGAKRYIILIQVLYENLITSLIGGIVGLIFSYIVVFWMKDWLLKVPDDAAIPLNTIISPFIFIAVFCVCIFINLLSAGIPAFRASRMTIINSLNQNDKQL